MITLGIETSCDETSICIIRDGDILSLQTFSQIDLHKMYGGVVPEIASRDHLNRIDKVAIQCLGFSGIKKTDINLVAYTSEPGLVGSLLTGILFAKGLALSLGVPAIPVNHILAHVFTCNLTHKVDKNFLCLLVSGGHTAVFNVKDLNSYEILGKSIDDSVGEVFDKLSKALGFGYPGGAIIESLAKFGDDGVYRFNIPLGKKDRYNFSMSGLKTEFLKIIQGLFVKHNVPHGTPYEEVVNNLSGERNGFHSYAIDVANLCASFQRTVAVVLLDRLKNIVKDFKLNSGVFVLCGGVASNEFIRKEMGGFCSEYGMSFCVPDKQLCTDNAAMIANLGQMIYISDAS
jgi:N6-L-threonylcarbamoyladenine synthase